MKEVQVQFLFREPGSHMPAAKDTNRKQKKYCNKVNKDFKKGPYQKILKKKRTTHL